MRLSSTQPAAANPVGAVKITALPGMGSLNRHGEAVTPRQLPTRRSTDPGKLVYSPAANANGTAYASFTFQVQDDGGTANAGVDLQESPDTVTVEGTPLNEGRAGADQTLGMLEDAWCTCAASDLGFSAASE